MNKLYYHHFHKCAGSSVVSWLRNRFGEPGININGNLVDTLGIAYPLHLYSDDELEAFILKYDSAEWIAYEWGIPNLSLMKRHRYTTTVIREPRERLLSNYIYDYTNGSTRLKLSEYVKNVSIPFWYHEFYFSEILRNREIQLPFDSIIQARDYLLSSFDEIWLLKKGNFFLVQGEGVLESALDIKAAKNERRVRFYKRPKVDISLVDYCNKDSLLFDSLLNYSE